MSADPQTIAAIALARRLASLVHHDDVLERFRSVQPDPPAGVTVEIDSMGNNPERVRSFILRGRFDVETLHANASDVSEYGRAEVVLCRFRGIDADPVAWMWTADHTMQHAGVVGELAIEPVVQAILVRPGDPRSATQGATQGATQSSAPPVVTRSRAPADPVDQHRGTLIGAVEEVPAFDFASVLDDFQFDVLQRVRSVAVELWDVARFELADPDVLTYGAPPAFAPVIDLMVDGMRLGFMIDAPELCTAGSYLCAFGLTMDGFVPVDQSKVLGAFVPQRITDIRASERSPTEQQQWEDRALRVLRALGKDDFSRVGDRGFAMSTKRRRPLSAPTGSRWRNDSSGNGVLAAKEAWGTATVKRPGTIANGLKQASAGLAPAAALYCAQESLVLANAANDVASVSASYAAMVEPLTELGRPSVAARASALADIPVAP